MVRVAAVADVGGVGATIAVGCRLLRAAMAVYCLAPVAKRLGLGLVTLFVISIIGRLFQ